MKVVKFLKENKIITLSLIIVILSFVLLALPGQFAHLDVGPMREKITYKYNLNGYQWMFATVKNVFDKPIGSPVGSGIAAFVMLILVFVGLLFSKKSSFASLLVSLALITISILFFASSVATEKAYSSVYTIDPNGEYHNMSWVPYVVGSLTIIAGGLMMYRTVLVLRDEIKRPTQGKGPTYSYLHK